MSDFDTNATRLDSIDGGLEDLNDKARSIDAQLGHLLERARDIDGKAGELVGALNGLRAEAKLQTRILAATLRASMAAEAFLQFFVATSVGKDPTVKYDKLNPELVAELRSLGLWSEPSKLSL